MANNLISVIVPIYKVEDYLSQCIESIISQTYRNLEIILVDDGSPDKCPQICEDYAKRDNRIKVVHQLNGGLAAARNAGLKIASGDYVSFVDSDDWLMPEMYETLLSTANTANSDITVCDYYISSKDKLTTKSRNTREMVVLNSPKDFYLHIIEPYPILKFEVWNKLFRRNLIDNTRFKKGQIYEDIYFDRILLSKSKLIAFVDAPLYVYRQNRPGATNSAFNEKRLCKFEELNALISDIEKLGYNEVSLRYKRYGAENAIAIYNLARKYKGQKKEKKYIYRCFEEYYKSNEYRSIRHMLFHYSPFLFSVISDMTKILR